MTHSHRPWPRTPRCCVLTDIEAVLTSLAGTFRIAPSAGWGRRIWSDHWVGKNLADTLALRNNHFWGWKMFFLLSCVLVMFEWDQKLRPDMLMIMPRIENHSCLIGAVWFLTVAPRPNHGVILNLSSLVCCRIWGANISPPTRWRSLLPSSCVPCEISESVQFLMAKHQSQNLYASPNVKHACS